MIETDLSDGTPESYRQRTYWLVFIYQYEPETPMGLLWSPVGLVEHRQTWQNWWKRVQEGDIELPPPYDVGDWCVMDRPVTFGLWGDEYAGGLVYQDANNDTNREHKRIQDRLDDLRTDGGRDISEVSE